MKSRSKRNIKAVIPIVGTENRSNVDDLIIMFDKFISGKKLKSVMRTAIKNRYIEENRTNRSTDSIFQWYFVSPIEELSTDMFQLGTLSKSGKPCLFIPRVHNIVRIYEYLDSLVNVYKHNCIVVGDVYFYYVLICCLMIKHSCTDIDMNKYKEIFKLYSYVKTIENLIVADSIRNQSDHEILLSIYGIVELVIENIYSVNFYGNKDYVNIRSLDEIDGIVINVLISCINIFCSANNLVPDEKALINVVGTFWGPANNRIPISYTKYNDYSVCEQLNDRCGFRNEERINCISILQFVCNQTWSMRKVKESKNGKNRPITSLVEAMYGNDYVKLFTKIEFLSELDEIYIYYQAKYYREIDIGYGLLDDLERLDADVLKAVMNLEIYSYARWEEELGSQDEIILPQINRERNNDYNQNQNQNQIQIENNGNEYVMIVQPRVIDLEELFRDRPNREMLIHIFTIDWY